jgi:hypothetical protein
LLVCVIGLYVPALYRRQFFMHVVNFGRHLMCMGFMRIGFRYCKYLLFLTLSLCMLVSCPSVVIAVTVCIAGWGFACCPYDEHVRLG